MLRPEAGESHALFEDDLFTRSQTWKLSNGCRELALTGRKLTNTTNRNHYPSLGTRVEGTTPPINTT